MAERTARQAAGPGGGGRAARAADPEHAHLIRYGGAFAQFVVERAAGSWLETEDGRRILDFTSGQMCATLGHGHPAIAEAIQRASGQVVHLFSGFLARDVIELARELMAMLPGPLTRAMFLSTGGEANEAALRLAQLHTRGPAGAGLPRPGARGDPRGPPRTHPARPPRPRPPPPPAMAPPPPHPPPRP